MNYVVRITKLEMVRSDLFRWADFGLACFINDSLKDQGAPFVERAFLCPEAWRKEIMAKYNSVTVTTDIKDESTVYTFKLGESDDHR